MYKDQTKKLLQESVCRAALCSGSMSLPGFFPRPVRIYWNGAGKCPPEYQEGGVPWTHS